VREIFSRRRGDVFDSIRVLTFYSPSLLSSYIYIYIYVYNRVKVLRGRDRCLADRKGHAR